MKPPKENMEQCRQVGKGSDNIAEDFNAIKEVMKMHYWHAGYSQRHRPRQVCPSPGSFGVVISRDCLVQEGDYVSVSLLGEYHSELVVCSFITRCFRNIIGYLPRIQSTNFKTPYDNKVYRAR